MNRRARGGTPHAGPGTCDLVQKSRPDIYRTPRPPFRRLRIFSLDPSLGADVGATQGMQVTNERFLPALKQFQNLIRFVDKALQ